MLQVVDVDERETTAVLLKYSSNVRSKEQFWTGFALFELDCFFLTTRTIYLHSFTVISLSPTLYPVSSTTARLVFRVGTKSICTYIHTCPRHYANGATPQRMLMTSCCVPGIMREISNCWGRFGNK